MSFAHLERNCASSAVAATTQILNFELQKNILFYLQPRTLICQWLPVKVGTRPLHSLRVLMMSDTRSFFQQQA